MKPKTTEEVTKIVKYCNANKLALCTQGGNTGCSAGAVPVFDEIILSTELMNEIIDIDENAGKLNDNFELKWVLSIRIHSFSA